MTRGKRNAAKPSSEELEIMRERCAVEAKAVHAPVLLVVLRGEAFRSGYQGSRDTAAEGNDQRDALKSLLDKVVAPAAAQGWEVVVIADVVTSRGEPAIRGAINRHLGRPAFIRVRSSSLSSQADSVSSTLEWCASCPSGSRASSWSALLLIRLDVR